MKAALITIGVELSLCTVPWASVRWELIMFEAGLSLQLHCFNYGPHRQAVHTPNSFLWLNSDGNRTYFVTVNDSFDNAQCLVLYVF